MADPVPKQFRQGDMHKMQSLRLPQPLRAPAARQCRHVKSCCNSAVVPAPAKPLLQPEVVIIGAGIIGLMTADTLLQQGLSVTVVERKHLCAGATGAGQGYIWMAHRNPDTPAWELAAASTALWRQHIASDPTFAEAVEWQTCGSLLLGCSEEEEQQLRAREHMLAQHGVTAAMLDRQQLRHLEPALAGPAVRAALRTMTDTQIVSHGQHLGRGWQGTAVAPGQWLGSGIWAVAGGGLGVSTTLTHKPTWPGDDAQNGRLTVAALLRRCEAHGAAFTAMFHSPVTHLELGDLTIVHTQLNRLRARNATIVAAGAWSGELLSQATGQPCYQRALQPRKGHLLQLPRPQDMPPLSHGAMEMAYTKHYPAAALTSAPTQAQQQPQQQQQQQQHSDSQPTAVVSAGSSCCVQQSAHEIDITFTATTSADGSLLVGSSREFAGWGSQPSPSTIQAVLERAAAFLPHLAPCSQPSDEAVRVGLRPFAVGGMPLIGPVPGHPGLFMAAGHEGSGLCLGPATVQLLSAYVTGQPGEVNVSRFTELLPENRLLCAELVAAAQLATPLGSHSPSLVTGPRCMTALQQEVARIAQARASAQLTDVPSAPSPPSPPLLAARPPGPPLYTPLPQQPNVTRIELLITFYGLDLWSLLTSWGSRIQALLDAQRSPSLRIQDLARPGMCASQLLALNTTALLNTSLTPQELMPAFGLFTTDVAQLLRNYVQDSSISVQVPDFCAGNRTVTPLAINRTLVNVILPTLHVTVNLLNSTLDRLLPPSGELRQLLRNCRGSLMTRDSLRFFDLYGMPFSPCRAITNASYPTAPSQPPSPSFTTTTQPEPQPPTPQPLTPCSPSAPPLSSMAAYQLPAAGATGESVSVSGPFPVVNVVTDNRGNIFQLVLFGPISGDGREFTFSTCFEGAPDWDSVLDLYQADSVEELDYCGGNVHSPWHECHMHSDAKCHKGPLVAAAAAGGVEWGAAKSGHWAALLPARPAATQGPPAAAATAAGHATTQSRGHGDGIHKGLQSQGALDPSHHQQHWGTAPTVLKQAMQACLAMLRLASVCHACCFEFVQHYPAAALTSAPTQAQQQPQQQQQQQHSDSQPTAVVSAGSSSCAQQSAHEIDITFTATTSADGSLLVGSSREFAGWGSQPSPSTIQSVDDDGGVCLQAVLERAAAFLPHLAPCSQPSDEAVRVGLRPFAVGGMPLIGPVPGHPGLFMAAGHEGSGLCLGPATVQLLSAYVTGQLSQVNVSRFMELLPENRLLCAELVA
ncbi:hypothetical protein QJQ45_026900 [Haematococcus lacustris]|nr:hypothetical protein QJQ45_026900 [Haematococcus lacustris]